MANAPQLTPKVPHDANTPAGTPSVYAEALRVTSKNATEMPADSIIQSGKNYNSNPQPAAQTGNTSAKTGPASAALRQEYQTRVADAIQAGDYERAYALYREYRNPELRAFKDFYARKTFTEYAGANGYGLPSDRVFGTDESLTAFEESYRNAMEGIENNDNNDIINEESIDEIDLQSDYGKLIDSQKEVDKYYAKAIKSTFRSGTSLAKKVFLKYVKPDSIASTTENSSYFKNGKVHLCAAKDINRKTGKVKNYFHEHGHYIDFFAAGSKNENRLSMLNVQFGKKLRSDYAAYLQKTMNVYGVSQGDAEAIISIELEAENKHGVSDIIDGITDGKVFGCAQHSFTTPGYWNDPGRVEREAFANMFQSCFEPKSIRYMAEYFPKAYKEFKKMLKGLI